MGCNCGLWRGWGNVAGNRCEDPLGALRAVGAAIGCDLPRLLGGGGIGSPPGGAGLASGTIGCDEAVLGGPTVVGGWSTGFQKTGARWGREPRVPAARPTDFDPSPHLHSAPLYSSNLHLLSKARACRARGFEGVAPTACRWLASPWLGRQTGRCGQDRCSGCPTKRVMVRLVLRYLGASVRLPSKSRALRWLVWRRRVARSPLPSGAELGGGKIL